MKNKILKSILGLTLSSMLFVGCVNDDDYSVPQIECDETTEVANLTIADLKASATTTATQYQNDDIIEGVIVSTDRGGNFYKLIYVNSVRFDEETQKEVYGEYAFSIAVNQTNTWQQYNVGRKIYVHLKGLYVQLRNNTLQIGALYNGNVGQIADADFAKYVTRSCKVVSEDLLIQEMSLTDAVKDENLGKLIKLKEVQFAETSLGQNYYNPANVVGGETNHKIVDLSPTTLIFRTGSYAEYAYLPVSENSGDIIGVLTKYNQDFQFVSRLKSDIILANDGRLIEEPVEPGEPGEPGEPSNGVLLFNGGDFENWATFMGAINSQFGLKPYAVQAVGAGITGSNALHLSGTPTGNDYVFTAKAPAGLPANPTKITFWVKGTAGKSLSLNVNRSTSGFEAFNVGVLGSTAVTIDKNPELNPSSGSGANQYVGAINTNNQWVKVTLNISDMSIMATEGSDFFSLKVGKDVAYDLYLDNFMIE